MRLPNKRWRVDVHVEEEWGEGHGGDLEGRSEMSWNQHHTDSLLCVNDDDDVLDTVHRSNNSTIKQYDIWPP